MSQSINSVTISGRLTRDPEVRSTAGGTQLMTFGMAVNDRRKSQQTGKYEDVPNFVDVVMFGNAVEWMSRDLEKGKLVFVNGRLRYSSWERDGQKRSKLEVVADTVDYERPPREQNGYQQGGYQQGGYQQNGYQRQPQYQQQYQPQPQQDPYSDEIPF